ncbi:MAG: Ig-like domain-containing protein [Gemmatimonadota bacterium]|nr:Ig-like domain-containing protein [Gemmatimonadota bacterium]
MLFGIACASPGMPPGGPPDAVAPQILSISPDSGTVGVKPKQVIFRFDEVVSERPPAVTTLSDLFLISPRDGVPDASWHRDAIAVKPSSGWRANTPYTVIMLPGLADIRGNVRNTGATTFFSTGPTIPRTRISGHAFDWVTGSPASGGLVEAFVRPDSIHPYVALVDSSGSFVIEHLLPARYSVRGYLDRNKNLAVDPSEPWDSVSVNLVDSARVELLLFVHDTVAPRIRDVNVVDSLSLRVTFDKPVDPTQTLSVTNFAIIGRDSTRVPITSAGAAPRDTTPTRSTPNLRVPSPLRTPASPRADTTAAVKPVMSRPAPISTALIKLQHPLTPKVVYRVRAIGIRGVLGHTGDSERAYTAPAPVPPPAKPDAAPPASPSIKR